MLATVISYIPASALLALLGLVIVIKDRNDKAHVGFSAFTFIMSFWLILLCLADLARGGMAGLWLLRMAAFLGTLLLPAFMMFCLSFPLPSRHKHRSVLLIYALPSPLIAVLSLTPFMIPAVTFTDNTTQPAELGLLYTTQSLYLFLGFLLCLASLLFKYRLAAKPQRRQIIIVLFGLLIAVIANLITGYINALYDSAGALSNLAGSISVLLFATLTVFALFRYKLFELRTSIVRSLGYILALLTAALIFIGLLLLVGALFYQPLVKALENDIVLAILIFFMLTVGMSFTGLKKLSARATKRLFM